MISWFKKHPTASGILVRVAGLFLVLVATLFLYAPFYKFLLKDLHYVEPGSLFIILGALAAHITAMELAFSFYGGIFFALLGRRKDYVFIFCVFVLLSLDFWSYRNMTWLVYSGLVGATVLGLAGGFILNRLGRLVFAKK